ncbi:zinc finger domain-containing protein [Streptomyces sp. NPDC004779]
MTIRPNAPMPDDLRHFMRAGQHPARAVNCPHCGAAEHRPCRIPSSGRVLNRPHPQRISVWAEAIAVCPHCQVAPGTPCHTDGIPLPDQVHARRYLEAEEMAA